ncbi:hypothetical protein HDV05_008293 [Chytridiales sp. JEL 0842]|nr:hypothetical protein HDV05_008293 [Chytridiales sp. JEL 0842]
MEAGSEGPVRIGDSLARLIKSGSSTGGGVMGGYTTVQYNFKPDTIDLNEPGTLAAIPPPGKSKESPNPEDIDWSIELPSTTGDGVHLFKGQQSIKKDVECLIFYDPDTNTYTLETIDASFKMKQQRSAGNTTGRKSSTSRPSASTKSSNIAGGTHSMSPATSSPSRTPDTHSQASPNITKKPPTKSAPPTSKSSRLANSTTAPTKSTSSPSPPRPSTTTSIKKRTISSSSYTSSTKPKSFSPTTLSLPPSSVSAPSSQSSTPEERIQLGGGASGDSQSGGDFEEIDDLMLDEAIDTLVSPLADDEGSQTSSQKSVSVSGSRPPNNNNGNGFSLALPPVAQNGSVEDVEMKEGDMDALMDDELDKAFEEEDLIEEDGFDSQGALNGSHTNGNGHLNPSGKREGPISLSAALDDESEGSSSESDDDSTAS